MKTTLKYQKKVLLILLAGIVLINFSTCKKDEDNDEKTNDSISGKWEFIITPDAISPDTTNAHGYTGSDFKEYDAINDEVYLYEEENGTIVGFTGPFKLQGQINETNITLQVFINPNGDYNPVLPISSMQLFSTMSLVKNKYGFLSGNGTYEDYPEYPNFVNNTYLIKARMLSPIRDSKVIDMANKNQVEVCHWYDFVCNEIDKLVGWIAKDLTDGKIRPMDGCSFHKNGGGYYVLGHEGPGRDFDIFSITLYYPYEWCGCGSRSYDFDVSIGSEHMSIEKLVEKVQSSSIKDLAKKLGFDLPDDLFFALEEFHNEFGGFAISIGYSANTHNLAFYVNHTKGNSNDAKNHQLIQAMKSALSKHVHYVYVYAGHSIHDHWHLVRSWHFTCNTPLVFTYLLGTHNVSYD